ncbi:antibiotic biosynthesis monooxygenase [uncultured Thiodictyon sp.]|uniref:antibiotic biosynthesis monooxygenase family protein n=1 Tax=uncultured Thiodictyon sp. TaxID=1846217 RepID=UPI0025F2DA0B|nr:antibiotic biosynthesis monooxygenase [uncultured Thiodictyon sp.]
MIVRVFRVTVPRALHLEFEGKFLSVSIPAVRSQPGLVSVTVGRPTRWAPDEYAMISTWEDARAVAAFAGAEWRRAVIPEGMERYVADCSVHHYEVFG